VVSSQTSHLGLVRGSQPAHHFFNVALLFRWQPGQLIGLQMSACLF
jgi:hypothetical protein